MELLVIILATQVHHPLRDQADPLLVIIFAMGAIIVIAFWESINFFAQDFKHKQRNLSNHLHYYVFVVLSFLCITGPLPPRHFL